MPIMVVEEKLRLLPQEALDDVGNYIEYLLHKFNVTEHSESSRLVNRKAGLLHDDDFYMSPDFDETPECFKDYV